MHCRFLLFLGLFTASLSLAADKPNFILINIDDLGYADIGPFGSTLNRTPNLDRMAAEGMKLRCHYAAPVCSPSRSALMTGCYPKRVLPIPSVLFPASSLGLNPKEITVAEVLKDAGYATACIGKWHLGDQPPFLPTAQGFDHYFGIPYSNDMGLASEGSKSDLDKPLPAPKKKTAPLPPASFGGDETGLKGDQQPPLPLLRDTTVIGRVDAEGQQSITRRYTEEALSWLRDHHKDPFFLYLPHSAVHFPIYPGKAFQNRSPHGIYSDWVEEVDWSVGQILDTVRSLGLESRTLVIFTSDNGGTARAVNAPLRGNKGSTWEGGMRVPTVAWWPGKVPAGTSTDEITSMMDVLPTFAHLASGKIPTDRVIDGGNIWPLLSATSGAKSPHADVFYYFRGLTLEAVRSGPWKLQLSGGGATKKKNDPAKLAPKNPAEVFPKLYHLGNDIGESTNLAVEHPDEVARLRTLADKMKDDLGRDGIGPGVREMGHFANPKPLIPHDAP